MIDRFTNIVAYAKAATPSSILTERDTAGLMRRAKFMGLDDKSAKHIVQHTKPARKVNPKLGEVVQR